MVYISRGFTGLWRMIIDQELNYQMRVTTVYHVLLIVTHETLHKKHYQGLTKPPLNCNNKNVHFEWFAHNTQLKGDGDIEGLTK